MTQITQIITQLYDDEMEKYNQTGDSNNMNPINQVVDIIYNELILNKSLTAENKELLKIYLSGLTTLALGEAYWDDCNKPIIEKQIELISSGLLLRGNGKQIENRLIKRRKFLMNEYGI